MSRTLNLSVLGFVLAVAQASLAAPVSYFAFLDGPSEPTISPGTGNAQVDLDIVAHSMRVRANFTGLLAPTTAAHVHAPTAVPGSGTAGVATQTPSFSGFPLGVTSGSMDTTFDTSLTATWNASYITANGGTALGAEAALSTALSQGRAYFNIHSQMFPGGEIRGFLAVPEPGSAALLGIAGVLYLARRRVMRTRAY